jgi:hypothetical protein
MLDFPGQSWACRRWDNPSTYCQMPHDKLHFAGMLSARCNSIMKHGDGKQSDRPAKCGQAFEVHFNSAVGPSALGLALHVHAAYSTVQLTDRAIICRAKLSMYLDKRCSMRFQLLPSPDKDRDWIEFVFVDSVSS